MRDGDRRVRYTKMVLRQNMIELLGKKPVSRISVTELCRLADINRGTFYAHYSDPADLLSEMQTELYGDIKESLAAGKGCGDAYEICLGIISALDKNRDLCRVVLGDGGNANFLGSIFDLAYGFFIERWTPRKTAPREISEYVFRYLSAGSVDVIRRWLLQDDARSCSDIARIIADMSKLVADAYLIRKHEPTARQ